MRKMTSWLKNYENRKLDKQGWQSDESWQSNKYDFNDPSVRLEYVPEMKCSVGGCISALKKNWRAFYIAGRNGEPRGDIAWRINHIQDALGLSLTEFYEYPGIYQSREEESNEDQDLTVEEIQAQREEKAESDGVWNLNPGTSEEWSELDRKLLREELEAEEW